MPFIGFGKFSKFYWLIIVSATIKLIISILFKLEYINRNETYSVFNSSLIKEPVINKHIFVYFIYYYLGFFNLSLIFLITKHMKRKNKIDYKQPLLSDDVTIKSNQFNNNNNASTNSSGNISLLNISNEMIQVSFLFPNYQAGRNFEPIKILLPIALVFMVSEMIIFYFDQMNLNNISFFMLEIFFIYFFLLKENKFKLYRHHILSFVLILIFGFVIKLVSSLLPQCEYEIEDPEEAWNKIKDKVGGDRMKDLFYDAILTAVKKTNDERKRKCSNAFNISFRSDFNVTIYLIVGGIGYLIAFVLHSFSIVKIRHLLNVKYFSPYSIIFFIGVFGLISSIISLTFTSLFPCGKDISISKICPSTFNTNITIENENSNNNNKAFFRNYRYLEENKNILKVNETYYLDNIITYYTDLNIIIEQNKKQVGDYKKEPKDAYIEIVSCFTILPCLSFFKATFDFFIIKELGVFQSLLPELLYQLIKDPIVFIIKIKKHILDKTQIIQFIIIGISNLIAFLGFSIYLELIELKFWNLDKDTKNNITLRGKLEAEGKEDIFDNEIAFGDSIYIINEDRDSFNENKTKTPK